MTFSFVRERDWATVNYCDSQIAIQNEKINQLNTVLEELNKVDGCTALSSISADGMALSRSMYVLGGIGTVGAGLTSDDILQRYAILTSMSNIMRDYCRGDKTKLLALGEALRIEEEAQIADEDAAYIDKRPWFESIKSVGSYLWNSTKSLLLGNFSDTDPTLLSTGANVIAGIADVDLPMDIRDLFYDITHWGEGEHFYRNLLLDGVAILPIIGFLKYTDEAAAVVKQVDNVSEFAKLADDVKDFFKPISNFFDGIGDLKFANGLQPALAGGVGYIDEMADAAKYTDNVADIAKQGDKISDAGKQLENITDSIGEIKHADEVADGVKQGEAIKDTTSVDGEIKKLSVPNSKTLRKNMIESGIVVPDYPNAAHHIIASSSPKANEARDILQKFGVDINDAENGVFLPTQKGLSDSAYHPSLHTKEYYRKVT